MDSHTDLTQVHKITSTTLLRDTYKLDKGLTYRLNSDTQDYQHKQY